MTDKKGQLGSLASFAVGFLALILVITVISIALPIIQDATIDTVVYSQNNETIGPAIINTPIQLSYDDIVNITQVTNGSNYQLAFNEYSNTNFTLGTFLLTTNAGDVNNTKLNVTYTYNALNRNVANNITTEGIASISLFSDWFKILIVLGIMVTVIGLILSIQYFRSGGSGPGGGMF